MNLTEKYNEHLKQPSDINELLGFLYQYAVGCNHITEMGTRRAVSTYAFLMAFPKKLVCYDLARYPEITELVQHAKQAGVKFEFHVANVLDVEIEETDMLFIDTYHTETQCKAELAKHAGKVKKYIAFHDVFTYGEQGEPPYNDATALMQGRGIMYAIKDFLQQHPEWKQVFKTEINNGLLILERQ